MPYEAQCAQLARCTVGHHGDLKEVVFLSGNKDYLLVFADGTVLAPSDGGSLKREYEAYAGYGEIAQQLGGTQPYSLLAFGYQGTGPRCFASFLKTAGFNVSESDIVQMSPPLRLRADGSRVSGHAGDGGRIRWEDQSDTPIVKDSAAAAPPLATPVCEAAGPPPVQATKVEDQHREPTHAPAADWYKDPAGRHQYRYWDGASWTHQVADAGRQSIDPLVATPGATTSAYVQQPQQPSPGRGVVRIIVGVVMILLFFTGFFGNPPDTLSYALGGGVLFAVPGVLLILWGWYGPSRHRPVAGPAVATPTQAVPYVAAQAPAAPPRTTAPQPASSQVGVEFDEHGRVSKVTLQQHGQWTVKRDGTCTYYSRQAGTLLEATEILQKTEGIPGLTYYVVDTPDGSLGRDMNGYYTGAPLKTKNLRLAVPDAASETVEFASLKMFGDSFQNQSVVAALKQSGKYARLVLLMECGRCGYQSPVETQEGSLARECYCCGASNTGTRGGINVIVSGGRAVEI